MLPLALKELYATMLKYSSERRHKFKVDKLLPTKILFAVDQEVQRWLKENRNSKMREEIDDEILEELPKIVTNVVRHRFAMDDLPEVFKIEEKDVTTPLDPLNKKQKGEHHNKGNKVINTDPNPEYKMLEGEDFKKVYCGKNSQFRPFWDKAKVTKR